MRPRAQQLSNSLLPDNRVRLRPQTRAHENVLNVAQPAQLPVQQIFAVTGAKQPPRHHHLALLRRAVELPPANLQHHLRNRTFLRTFRRNRALRLRLSWGLGVNGLHRTRILSRLLLKRNTRLRLRDNLLDLSSPFRAKFLLVPVRIRLVDYHLRLAEQRPLVCVGIHQRQRHFRHTQRLPLARSGKNDVLHLAAAQALGALLAQNPAHRVQNVRFAAAIRTHHDRDPLARELDVGAVGKRLKA